ncbi:integrase core domain-containing protein [Legionella bozemanae]|uniref:integrase core domain-containing protein n=1 Tax=Legionella bozemanae TaxID=447 RepID=UPI00399D2036
MRREYLDRLFFWNENDLQTKLDRFKQYYNDERAHYSLEYLTPSERYNLNKKNKISSIHQHYWKSYCESLFQLPAAA